MARKKKEEFIEEDIEEEDDYDLDMDDDLDDKEVPDLFDGDEDTPNSPLGLAHQISKKSEVADYHKELPNETRYSFYDKEEKQMVKHYANTYNDWKYIEKLIDLRVMEDTENKKNLMRVKEVHTKEDLINYLKNRKRDYLINDIEDLTDDQVKLILDRIQNIKPNYILTTIENSKQSVNEIFDTYDIENPRPKFVDDSGNVAKIYGTSIASMGFQGKAAQHSVMTIQAVKNEDIQRQAEEKSKFSLIDSIKKRFT